MDNLNWTIILIVAGIATQLYETFQQVYIGKKADGTPLMIGDLPDPVHFLLITLISLGGAAISLVVQREAVATEPLVLYGIAVLLSTQVGHPLFHKFFPKIGEALEAKFTPPALAGKVG